MPASTTIVAVHEDWPGGAGNGLGTLYAFQKAVAKAAKMGKGDLSQQLKDGASVGMYHTAGKGTRLAPLPGSESNNKPAVSLPGVVSVDGSKQCMSILEAVIKQTNVYASSRGGRLSVFWGDQIFVPEVTTKYTATAHVDILARLGPWPTKAEWEARGLQKYGLIVVNSEGHAAQVEKVTHPEAESLLAKLGKMATAGTSLGSFSVSHEMLAALLAEFAEELKAKKGKLDTDPHWWMPMTLPRDGYIALMAKKGATEAESSRIYARVAGLTAALRKRHPDDRLLFAAVDVGAKPYWWDYGQVQYYRNNNLRIVQDDAEAVAMRTFFGVDAALDKASADSTLGCTLDRSLALTSTVLGGRVRSSLLVNCRIREADIEDSILMNVTAAKVVARGNIIYNVCTTDDLALSANTVRADAHFGHSDTTFEAVTMISACDNDGRASWDKRLPGSALSASELHKRNQSVSVQTVQALRRRVANTMWEKTSSL